MTTPILSTRHAFPTLAAIATAMHRDAGRLTTRTQLREHSELNEAAPTRLGSRTWESTEQVFADL